MAPDPVGAQRWGCRCFGALWSDAVEQRWFSHGCCQHILHSCCPNGSAGGSAVAADGELLPAWSDVDCAATTGPHQPWDLGRAPAPKA